MSRSSGSSGGRRVVTAKIKVTDPQEIEGNVRRLSRALPEEFSRCLPFQTFTDDQLTLIDETLDLVMYEKFGRLFDDDDFVKKSTPEASPGLTEQSLRSSASNVPRQKQDNLVLNVTEVQEKICRCLYDISSHLQRHVSFEDDEEDEAIRRIRRFEEFSIRLSRNYLYRVTCLLAELPATKYKKLLDKTNQLFTEILHTLRFYCNNMTSYTNDMQRMKLIEMINVILKTSDECLKMNIFDEEDELMKRISEMCIEILRVTKVFSEVPKKPPKRAPKAKSSKKKRTPNSRTVEMNPLAMYLPQQKTPKKTPSPSFRLNLQGSDDEASGGISRESSTKHLDTVTTDDRLKSMEEPELNHPSTGIVESKHDGFRQKSRHLHRKVEREVPRKDRASSLSRSHPKIPNPRKPIWE
ncbi:uncharacterized protein LOC129806920 isoform X2 [Phlebotomus papatasi]|uniref:uncharacterized protein LOC129806920 isoform X2 n=1 Tax=Phlebotomus papatasi TaxID=29031 RepID=UPI0024841586|nr:uncharacterized protein LOC129806920 isoform X2 [Phlebotomus papatasi]